MTTRARIDVSLTDFVDFAISSGTPKLTKVAELIKRGEYHPAFDYWKPMREGLINFHQTGQTDSRVLDRIRTSLTDRKKIGRFTECIAGYKKFLGRREHSWFEPWSAGWGPRGMRVRVNPELGLRLNGHAHLVKLYFKTEPLSKRKTDLVLTLMAETLMGGAPRDARVGILDVPRGKLFTTAELDRKVLPLLYGEAMSLKTIWESLEAG